MRADPPALGCDGGKAAGQDLGAEVGGDRGEIDVTRAGDRERLGDGHRAVAKLALGREQRDGDAIAGQRAQRHHRLERRDAAAGDHDVQGP